MNPTDARPLRILYVCSFRSGHSRSLVEFFASRPDEFEVVVLSSDGGAAMPGVRLMSPENPQSSRRRNVLAWIAERWMARMPVPTWIWRRLTDYRYRLQARALESRVLAAMAEETPDVVHVLRIQPEGLGAAAAKRASPEVPFFLAIWGLDLVLMAQLSSAMRRGAEEAVRAADVLIPDNDRDARLARESFGLRQEARVAVFPVTGGLDPRELEGGGEASAVPRLTGEPTLVCMRGYENLYVRIEVLVEALALFRERQKGARLYLLAPADFADSSRDRVMAGWARKYGVEDAVEILHPKRGELFSVLRQSDLYVSATLADGMPMSLLEALYLGLVPVVFDHESTRALLGALQSGVTFDRIDARSIAAAWGRALPQLPDRPARARRNRERLAAGYLREPNLQALARLYREAVSAEKSTSRNRSSRPAIA